MKTVRFGVVGVGGMGGSHARGIVKAASRQFKLTAVADIDRAIAERVGGDLKVPHFYSGPEMFASGLCDAVIIATPHYWHPVLTIQAARAGLHVLSEKPLSVTVGDARLMVEECKRRKVVLAAMLQQRTRGVMVTMKKMIDRGAIGEIFRVSMVCSNWYRSQRYYDSGAWRGTWDGEGGGILLNQAPHSLDLFQWIGGGLPKRVIATVGTRVHKIEVENVANAICDYGNGKTGYIYATTAEAPGSEQLMVAGDKGTLIAETAAKGGGTVLKFAKLAMPISRHLMTTDQRMKGPECQWQDVDVPNAPGGHVHVIGAMAKHLLSGGKKPLVATGAEAIAELELSNAIYIAGFKNKAVDFPVDAKEIDALIGKLQKERSTGRGGDLRGKARKELRKLMA